MVLHLGATIVDLQEGQVRTAEGTDLLTEIELQLLRYLAAHAGTAIARSVLLSEVWGYSDRARTRTLDVAVRRLRKKIESDPSAPRFLQTVRGLGYRLAAPRSSILHPGSSRAVHPSWTDDPPGLAHRALEAAREGDAEHATALAVMTLRTVHRVGPAELGVELVETLDRSSLCAAQRAWILGEALPLVGGEVFEAWRREALELAEAAGDDAVVARVLLRGARGASRRVYLERALEHASSAGLSAIRMTALGQLATAVERSQPKAAHALLLDALALAHTLGDAWEEAVINANLGVLVGRLGAHEEATSRLRRALETFRAWRDRPNVVNVLVNLGVQEFNALQLDVARACYKEAGDLADAMGDRGRAAGSRLNLWALESALGRRPAVAEVEAQLRQARRNGWNEYEVVALTVLTACRRDGPPALVDGPYQAARAAAGRLGDPMLLAVIDAEHQVWRLDHEPASAVAGALRDTLEILIASHQHDANLARLLLQYHQRGLPESPQLAARLATLATRLPAVPGTPWEDLNAYRES